MPIVFSVSLLHIFFYLLQRIKDEIYNIQSEIITLAGVRINLFQN